MFPYLLILFFVVSWITLEQKVIERKSFWIPLTALASFSGIRDFHVGTDSRTYVRSFINNFDAEYYEFDKNIEFGYQLLEYILLSLKVNYFWLFFVTSLLIVYCYLKIIKIYSVNYVFSVFLFITLGTYTFFFNGLRQGLAMAILVLATPYLLNKKLIPYLLTCFLASLFHISVLFAIPFYFLVNLKIKIIYKITLAFIISLVSSSFLVSYFASINERYQTYADVSEKSGGLLTLGFYAILVIFIYGVIHIYKIKDEFFNKLFIFYASGVIFMLPIALLSTNPSGPQRLLNYFTWTLILLLPVVFKKINNKYISVSFVIIAIIYFILTTFRFSNLVPYNVNSIFEIF